MLSATFTKLRDGSWGLRVDGAASPGDIVAALTAAGRQTHETIGAVLWSGKDNTTGAPVTIGTMARGASSAPPRAPTAARAPRAVAASGPVPVDVVCGPAACVLRVPFAGCADLRTALKAISCPDGWQRYDGVKKLWSFPPAAEAAVLAAVAAVPGVVLNLVRTAPVAAPVVKNESWARQLLGLTGAVLTIAGVKVAYRHAIKRGGSHAHPDHGGTAESFAEATAAAALLKGLAPTVAA